jgi:hypothetical protein
MRRDDGGDSETFARDHVTLRQPFCFYSPQGTGPGHRGWFREGRSGPFFMEDAVMFIRKGMFSASGRAAVLATVTAVAMTAIGPSVAMANGAHHGKATSATASTMTDVSARRRGGGGGAAAAAAFAGIVGTGLAIAATQNRRDYYDDGYYGGGPAYYSPQPYYGQPYYGGGGYYRSGTPYVNGHPLAGW